MPDLICREFERLGGPAPFRDAICLTQDEWDVITPEAVTALEDARFEAWLHSVANPPVATPGEPDPIVDFGD